MDKNIEKILSTEKRSVVEELEDTAKVELVAGEHSAVLEVPTTFEALQHTRTEQEILELALRRILVDEANYLRVNGHLRQEKDIETTKKDALKYLSREELEELLEQKK